MAVSPGGLAGRRWIDYMRLDDIRRAAANPKAHDEVGIRTSITAFGFVEPIVMDERTGRLVAGHGRLTELERLRKNAGKRGTLRVPDGIVVEDGHWLAPVSRGWSSRDDAQAETYLLASNRLVEAGGWDDPLLAEFLQRLTDIDPELPALAGFRDTEIAELLERLAHPAPLADGNPDRLPEVPGEATLRAGDLVELGPHRLIVGDSRDPEVLARLMAGDRAACLWTDPPYGVDITYGGMKIEGDEEPLIAVQIFTDALAALHTSGALMSGAAFYVAHPDGPLSWRFRRALDVEPWRYRQTLIWVKDRLVLGHSDYHYRHEPVAAGDFVDGPVTHEALGYGFYSIKGRRGRGSAGAGWYGGNAATSVIEIPRPSSADLHPTVKPVDLVLANLRASTRRAQLVLDPFAGSGTTLVAAHSIGRRARLVETDPVYADRIVARWTELTGEPSRAVS